MSKIEREKIITYLKNHFNYKEILAESTRLMGTNVINLLDDYDLDLLAICYGYYDKEE